MNADPAVDRRTLAIAVNVRNRCGLDPMLVGNIVTALNLDLRRGEAASSIAERIRHNVDHFADEHCDMRINQQFLDTAGAWRGARCVATSFNPVRWNPLVTNWSGFGVYRLSFEDTFTFYCTPLMKIPFAGFGALVDGPDGRGLVFQMTLPPNGLRGHVEPRGSGTSSTGSGAKATTFRDCTARFTAKGLRPERQLDRSTSTVSSRRAWITGYTAAVRTSTTTAATPVRSGRGRTPHSILMP